MQKLIVTLYPTKKREDIEVVNLLQAGVTASVDNIRDSLFKIDFSGKLVFVYNKEISKLLKDDYDFNDHGIYYQVNGNKKFLLELSNLYIEKGKLTAKLKNAYTRLSKKDNDKDLEKIATYEAALDTLQSTVDRLESTKMFIAVFCEQKTSKRDFERFMQFDSFIDPVFSYTKQPLSTNGKEYIFDIETTGLDVSTDTITFLGFKEVGSQTYWIEEMPTVENIKYWVTWMEGKKIIAHNALFDFSFMLMKAGIEFFPNIEIVDTMLLSHVDGEERLSLKHLAMMYGNFLGRRNTLTADENYLVEDLLSTEVLYEKYKSVYNRFAGRLICESVKVFVETKCRGITIDSDKLFQLRDYYNNLENPYSFNTDAPREVAQYFLENGVKLTKKTTTGQYTVDKNYLKNFSNPVVQGYLDYKKESTIKKMFIDPYCALEDYTLRPNIKLDGTRTGRLSCSNPNLQQIPNKSKFKDIFVSRFGNNGYIGTIDLDQAELRTAALLSNDWVYAKALLSNDFHRLVASKTFGLPEKEISKEQRFVAKSVNFGGVLYGGSAWGIAARIGVPSDVVKKVQDWYAENFVELTTWINEERKQALELSQVVTFFGRVRNFDSSYRSDEIERMGVNTKVQSVASDIMLYITTRMGSLLRQNKMKSKVLFPVHDELLFDIHKTELEQFISLLKQAFHDILKTPIGNLSLAKTLPISGTLEWANSWLYLKSEVNPPEGKKFISSLE